MRSVALRTAHPFHHPDRCLRPGSTDVRRKPVNLKQLLLGWALLWTLILLGLGIQAHRNVARILDSSSEVSGVIETERKFRRSQSTTRPMGNPDEAWQYEVVIRYGDNERWRYTGKSGTPGEVGDRVVLLFDRKTGSIYIKERLLAKGNPLLFFAGWILIVLVPCAIAKFLGLLKTQDAPG